MNKDLKLIITTCMIFALLMYVYPLVVKPTRTQSPNPDWQTDYATAVKDKGIDSKYFAADNLVDYNSYDIQIAINYVLSRAYDADDAAAIAAEYIYQNVKYDSYESDYRCLTTPASQILSGKTGQCDTQSRALVSLLRGMGMAATPVAGCIGFSARCQLVNAVTGIRGPQYQEITEASLIGSNFSRSGGLHTWVRVYLPDKGWKDMESTAGVFVNTGYCATYLEEYIPSTVAEECMSFNKSFAEECRTI
jgi:transglutaminase-like putative cysteine protease